MLEKNRGYFLYVLNYAIVLFLIGLGLLAWFHTFGLEKKLKENTAMAVEMKGNTTRHTLQNMEKWLKSQSELIPESIQRIDSIDIAHVLISEWETEGIEEKLNTRFPQIILFKMKQENLADDKLKLFAEKLYKQEGVHHFTYQNELTHSFSAVLYRIKLGFLILTGLFVLAGVLISEYLARVFVDFRESVIRHWHELGAAQEKFVRPYLKRVIYLGLASACLSVGLIGIIIGLSYYLIPWVLPLIETKKFMLVLIILVILGPTLQYILVKRKILALLNS